MRPVRHIPSSLYIHIPYCRNICDYCSFTVYKGNKVPDEYIESLILDWQQVRAKVEFKKPLKSIYFGGGTPSLLENHQIEKLMICLKDYIDDSTEITIEANPTSVLLDKALFWRKSGINRISLGVQSLNKSTLKVLTRTHDENLACRIMERLKEIEFPSFNVDIMFGVNGQDPEIFREGLLRVLSYEPSHLSAYELTIEPGTPFDLNKVSQADEDSVVSMLDILKAETKSVGIERYEISNFSKIGYESKHNQNYWMNRPYLAIGCGAWSFIEGVRSENIKDPKAYMNAVFNGNDKFSYSEVLEPEAFIRETMMTRLRMVKGIERKLFIADFGIDAMDMIGSDLDKFMKLNLIEISDENLRLTENGLSVANVILREIIA